MEQRPPRVFISYSHDTVAHQERVLDFAGLRCKDDDGATAALRQYVARLKTGPFTRRSQNGQKFRRAGNRRVHGPFNFNASSAPLSYDVHEHVAAPARRCGATRPETMSSK